MRQLSTIDITDKCHCSNFIGVFSIDTLPPVSSLQENSKFIVNDQPHTLPGGHWLAVYGDSIFDPLGIYYPQTLVNYLLQKYTTVKTNVGYTCQAIWDQYACGYFCLYYLHYGMENLIGNAYLHNLLLVSLCKFDCC